MWSKLPEFRGMMSRRSGGSDDLALRLGRIHRVAGPWRELCSRDCQCGVLTSVVTRSRVRREPDMIVDCDRCMVPRLQLVDRNETQGTGACAHGCTGGERSATGGERSARYVC